MKRSVIVLLVTVASLLAGCIVVPARGYYDRPHYHDSYRYYGSGYR
jgi:hypothetical protein